jgi:hypothetical protein
MQLNVRCDWLQARGWGLRAVKDAGENLDLIGRPLRYRVTIVLIVDVRGRIRMDRASVGIPVPGDSTEARSAQH